MINENQLNTWQVNLLTSDNNNFSNCYSDFVIAKLLCPIIPLIKFFLKLFLIKYFTGTVQLHVQHLVDALIQSNLHFLIYISEQLRIKNPALTAW